MVALCLSVVGAFSMLYYYQRLFMPRVMAVREARGLQNGYFFGDDFYQIWLPSHELLRGRRDPYTPEMTRDIQRGLYGRPLDAKRGGDPVDQRAFAYPLFTNLVFWPMAEIPFPLARDCFVALLTALLPLSVWLWFRALQWHPGWTSIAGGVLLSIFSYPALEALFAGQIGVLVAFLLPVSIVALQRQKHLLSGVLLALCTVKPQVTALAILFLLVRAVHDARRHLHFIIGFSVTLTALVAASVAVLPHWIQSWIGAVLAYRHYAPPPLVAEVITSSMGPSLAQRATLVLTIVSIIIACILIWRNRESPMDSLQFWLALTILFSITTIVLLPGQAVYDHLILIPSILVIVLYRSVLMNAGVIARVLLGVGAFVLLWPWIAAFGLMVVHPVLSPTTLNSTAVLSLPVRSAASLPFAVLALLVWMWRLTRVRSQAAV